MLRRAKSRLSTSKYYSKIPNLLYYFTEFKESYSITLNDNSYMTHRTTKNTLRSCVRTLTQNRVNICLTHISIDHANIVTSNLTKISTHLNNITYISTFIININSESAKVQN